MPFFILRIQNITNQTGIQIVLQYICTFPIPPFQQWGQKERLSPLNFNLIIIDSNNMCYFTIQQIEVHPNSPNIIILFYLT